MKFIILGDSDKISYFIDFVGKVNVDEVICGDATSGKLICHNNIMTWNKLKRKLQDNNDDILIVSKSWCNVSTYKMLKNSYIINYLTFDEIKAFYRYNSLPSNGMLNGRDKTIVENSLKNFKIKYPLKMDTDSDVEFYIVDAFEILHFLPFYKKLISIGLKCRIVIENHFFNSTYGWLDYNNAIELCKKNSIEYADLSNPNAEFAVTTQDAPDLINYRYKKIHYSYGVGICKNSYDHSRRTLDGFDYNLVNSQFSYDCLSRFDSDTEVYVIGNPKYYKYSKKKYNIAKIKDKLNIPQNRKILLYMPTWDDDESSMKFEDSIKKYRNTYFILTKAHHCTFRLEQCKDQLQRLYEISDMVLPGNYPFVEAAILADKAICDAKSGASLEVAYLNPDIDIVLLSPREKLHEYFRKEAFEIFNIINESADLDRLMNVEDEKKFIRKKNMTYFMGDPSVDYLEKVTHDLFIPYLKQRNLAQ